jgi:DNA invertase Pin-like site-specific DNA recombinase
MNEMLKVQSHHLERGAYLYIRQSSMRQVMENVESTKRQYDLRGRAIGLGWRDDQIMVIDSDQGESGASASWREGFQHLVSDVGMGRAGIVMGLEVSRPREKQRGLAPIAGNLRLGRHADPRRGWRLRSGELQ